MFIQEQSREKVMKNVHHRMVGVAVLLAVLLSMFPLKTQAQENTPPSGQEPSSDSSSQASQDSAQEPIPDEPITSTLETGPMTGQNNRIVALRWGHLSAFSVDTFYIYDTNSRNSAVNPQGESAVAARIVAVYAAGNDRLGLDVQYRPDVLISKSSQDAQFAASLINFHIYRPIGESWTFTLRDTFDYAPDFNFLNTPTVSLTSAGGFTQQSLLLNGTTELRNVLAGSFSYRLARHDHITFHAQVDFNQIENGPTSEKSSALFYGSGTTAGGGVAWTHSIGPNHEFGVNYNYDREVFGGVNTQGQYHTVVLNYRQKIGRSILLQATGGPSFHLSSNGTPTQKTFVGTANILKTFHQSSVGLLYSRGYEYTGIITDSYHDRYDAFYSRIFRNLFGAEGGVSYIQTHSTTLTQGIEARVIFARLNYFLTPHWTLFASFQNSALAGVTSPYVGRNFVTLGARWSYGKQHEIQPY